MKVLSLRQPWAHAMVLRRKRIETRSWRTHYRGPLAIHAARNFTAEEQQFARRIGLEPKELVRGAIVCVVDLVECLPVGDLRLAQMLTDDERLLGNYGPGRWGWVTSNPRQLREPLSAGGALSLWEHDSSAIEARL